MDSQDFTVVRWLRSCNPEELGAFAEDLWANIFRGGGLSYIPLCRIDDRGAPRRRGDQDAILPDYEVSGPGLRVYVDSKAKRQPVWYNNAREWRHGIEWRHWQHYQTVSECARQHCCLAIFECFHDNEHERWSGSLLVQTLHKLQHRLFLQHQRNDAGHNLPPKMVYWPRKHFLELGAVSPAQADALRTGRGDASAFRSALLELFEVVRAAPVQLRFF